MFYDVALFVLDHLRLFFGAAFIIFGSTIFLLILKASKKTKTRPISPDIRYADPSHNSKTWIKPSKVKEKSALVRSEVTDHKNTKLVNLDKTEIKNKILHFLSSVEKSGAEHKRIKAYGWGCVRGYLPQAKIPKEYNYLFKEIFDDLKLKKIVSYNKKGKIWRLNKTQSKREKGQKIDLISLTENEVSYFKYKKLGDGWFRLPRKTDGLDAIWWIQQNFTPDEFEQFCCAILSYHEVKNVRVSEKRSSGADDGIDGVGTYFLESGEVRIAIQAKRYRPDRQVQTQEIRDFIGALVDKDIDYGFFISTSIFSDRAKEKAADVTAKERNNIHLQLLDQDDLIKCLISRLNSPHGYGLHKTDDLGFYYLNPEMLRRAIKKY